MVGPNQGTGTQLKVRFRGGLVFEAHRLVYHSTLGLRVINKKKKTRLKVLEQRTCSGVVVTEAGSYLRLIDSCITQLKAQGPSRTCNESKEKDLQRRTFPRSPGTPPAQRASEIRSCPSSSLLLSSLELSDTTIYEP